MGKRKHSIHAGGNALAALLACCALGGCQGGSEDAERRRIETVDVAPTLDIGTEDDPQEAERPPELVGVLPADFPSDLPLYLPASLVDFGTREGALYVSLLTSSALSRVDRELGTLVREQGWAISKAAGDTRLLRKGSRRVRLRIENARPGTLYHFEY